MKLGASFGDSVEKSWGRKHIHTQDTEDAWWNGYGRILIFSVILVISLFILLARLFHLTVVNGHTYRVLADSNRIRELTRHAPRGVLKDRTGTPLVENIPRFRLLKPCPKDEQAVIKGCVESITQEAGEKMMKVGIPAGSFLETDYERRYEAGSALAHVLGYTGEISQSELTDESFVLRGYTAGDRIGRMGTELVFEDMLKGSDGRELVEVDAQGSIERILGRDREIPGDDITLSVDLAVSKAVRDAFPSGFSGAVVVSKPETGEILSIYSAPSFDPNDIERGLAQHEYAYLFESPDKPVFNRAISGTYPPGSTYKIVTAYAGLTSGMLTPQWSVEDTGIIHAGTFSFSNWYFTQYGRVDGSVNLVKAIRRSNDIYFYKAGEKIGIDILAEKSRQMGLGMKTGIELPGEVAGLMPDRAWKNGRFSSQSDIEKRNNIWYDGDTYHLAIGQGYLLTTPLQVNRFTNAIATGSLCIPTIEKVGNGSHTADCIKLPADGDVYTPIRKGMVEACSDGGTGYPLFDFSVKRPDGSMVRIPVACKTGTAETGDSEESTHAWFTAYAPVEDAFTSGESQKDVFTGTPEISVTVLVEKGGEGSRDAAPIAKKILEVWFSR